MRETFIYGGFSFFVYLKKIDLCEKNITFVQIK